MESDPTAMLDPPSSDNPAICDWTAKLKAHMEKDTS
jgi:hypothetical protein